MNYAEAHVLLNHIPFAATGFAAFLLLYSISKSHHKTTLTLITGLAIISFLIIPGFLTGEQAEKAIRNLPGIDASLIAKHRQIAGIGSLFIAGMFVSSCIYLVLYLKQSPRLRAVSIFVLLMALGVTGVMGYTGYTGLKIRHAEVYSNEIICAPHKSK